MYISRVFPLGLSVSLENLPDSWLGYEVGNQLYEILTGKAILGVCVQTVDSHLIPLLSMVPPSCPQLCWASWNSEPLD